VPQDLRQAKLQPKVQKALAAANEYYEGSRDEITMYDKAEEY
jgi:hypothetical protein